MINISIRGTSSPRKRKLIREAAKFAIGRLMPRKQNLFVDIVLNKIPDADGFCTHIDKDVFEIELRRNMNTEDLLTTIFHEFIHVKQYSRGELKDLPDKYGYASWKRGRIWSYDSLNSPWEVEAYTGQETMLEDWYAE